MEQAMVKLVAPAGVTSASFDGVEYKVDKKGYVEVPVAATLQLYSFGFGNAPAEAAPAAQGGKKDAPQP